MKYLVLVFATLLAAILDSSPAICITPATKLQSLQCNTGPVKKTYGKTGWLVYSCDDNHTIVIVSAPGNPARPYYFTYFPLKGGYKLYGEGKGHKEAAAKAYDELKTLSRQDIAILIEQTKKH